MFAQGVEGQVFAGLSMPIVPVFPAVAGGLVQALRGYAVDAAAQAVADERAILLHLRLELRTAQAQGGSGMEQAVFQQHAERDLHFGRVERGRRQFIGQEGRHDLSDALFGQFHIRRLRARCRSSGGAGAAATAPVVPVPKNGSSTTSFGWVQARMMRCSRASGFCVAWALWPFTFSRSSPAAEGNMPVAAHLQIVVAGFERLVVERVPLLFFGFFRPQQRLMRVAEPRPSEIRHGICL